MINNGHILRREVAEMRLESSVTEAWLNIVECPQNRSVGLVVWSPVYVCLIGSAVSFVFFFFCDCWDLVATMMPVISDQDNDAVVDVDDHLHQIGLWFSFAQ